MSPSAALQSYVFVAYLAIAAVLLIGAAIAIASIGWTTSRDTTHAWKSFRGWLVMIPIVFAAIFLGRVATILFFTLLAMLAFKELARATTLDRDRIMTAAVYFWIGAVGIVSLIHDPNTGGLGWYGLYMALPVYAISTLLVIPILRNRAQGALQSLSRAILGFIYIGWMFGHLAFLANAANGYGYLLFLLFAVELNDVAAFTFGRLFGKRQLRSNISPNKTWAGAIGATAVSLLSPWLLHFSFPEFSASECILTGLIVGIGGQLGDLAISVVKRDTGIKDMGSAIRGHGGILDRIDSLIFVAPWFFHMTRYFHGL